MTLPGGFFAAPLYPPGFCANDLLTVLMVSTEAHAWPVPPLLTGTRARDLQISGASTHYDFLDEFDARASRVACVSEYNIGREWTLGTRMDASFSCYMLDAKDMPATDFGTFAGLHQVEMMTPPKAEDADFLQMADASCKNGGAYIYAD